MAYSLNCWAQNNSSYLLQLNWMDINTKHSPLVSGYRGCQRNSISLYRRVYKFPRCWGIDGYPSFHRWPSQFLLWDQQLWGGAVLDEWSNRTKYYLRTQPKPTSRIIDVIDVCTTVSLEFATCPMQHHSKGCTFIVRVHCLYTSTSPRLFGFKHVRSWKVNVP